jgi:hypothetical protein
MTAPQTQHDGQETRRLIIVGRVIVAIDGTRWPALTAATNAGHIGSGMAISMLFFALVWSGAQRNSVSRGCHYLFAPV